LEIGCFVPIINHHQPAGICTVISGVARQAISVIEQPLFDLSQVIGTPEVKWNWAFESNKKSFVLSSVIDNLHFPAHHASSLANKLCTKFLLD
jgi:hypothetical protein